MGIPTGEMPVLHGGEGAGGRDADPGARIRVGDISAEGAKAAEQKHTAMGRDRLAVAARLCVPV